MINTRTFLREFSRIKARAARGETVRIQDRKLVYVFKCDQPAAKRTLLGAARGLILVKEDADLTAPTLPAHAWKPTL